jgi:hypothetical protein
LLALIRQKQLAKLRQAASQPASQSQACLFETAFLVGTAVCRDVSEFFGTSKKWDSKKQLVKINFVSSDVSERLRKHLLNRDILRNESKRIILQIA